MTAPGAVPGGSSPGVPPRYLLTCAPGLEGVVRGELRRAAPAVREVAGASVRGGVAVEAEGPEAGAAAAAQLRGLRSANNVYALLGTWRDFPSDRAAAEPRLKGLAAAVGAARWAAAEASVAAWDPARRKSAPVFRASCVRRHTCKENKHGFTSQEAARWVGEAVAGLQRNWKVSMTRFDLEVLVLLADRELSLCLCVLYRAKSPDRQPEGAQEAGGDALPVQELCKALGRQLHHRPFQRHLVKTSLKPSIAFALLTLAGAREHEVVLDPLCGCGTIPLEACAALGAAGLAGDLDDAAVRAARANTGSAGPDPCHWDATILPLRSGAVDAVVSDLPFGVRCGKNSAVLKQLYGFVYAEMARVLRPSMGRAALLAYGKSVTEGLEAFAAETGLIEQVQCRPVNMEGLDVVLLVFRRTSKPAPERQSTVRVGLPRGAEKRRKQWLSNSEKATKAKQDKQKKRRR